MHSIHPKLYNCVDSWVQGDGKEVVGCGTRWDSVPGFFTLGFRPGMSRASHNIQYYSWPGRSSSPPILSGGTENMAAPAISDAPSQKVFRILLS
jgi:hypothetical protein